jgi:hypothetical protein
MGSVSNMIPSLILTVVPLDHGLCLHGSPPVSLLLHRFVVVELHRLFPPPLPWCRPSFPLHFWYIGRFTTYASMVSRRTPMKCEMVCIPHSLSTSLLRGYTHVWCNPLRGLFKTAILYAARMLNPSNRAITLVNRFQDSLPYSKTDCTTAI